jgi:pimeloyl-ACP methyl ester carboxylesterase
MIKRYEVTGAGGVRLAAWEYAAEDASGGRRGELSVDPPDGTARASSDGPSRGSAEPEGGIGRPCLLLLHGLLGRASHWAETARRLSPRYRVLALDQRGHGRSDKPGGPYTPDAYAADAIAAVEQLGLGPVTLVGHSMGALTAWQCAAARPDLVAALVICDMRASALGEAGQREWEDWLAQWPVPFATLAEVRKWFAAGDQWAVPPNPRRGDFFAEVMEERLDGWYPIYAPGHLLASRDPWIRDAHWDELAQVACPALVVRGLDGELGRAEAQEMVRVLPRGHYAEIADAGHLVPWDRPDAFCSTVERFLGEALTGARQDAGSPLR